MATKRTVLITGNTYPVRGLLSALGGGWNGAAKGWNVPEDRADEARAIVAAGVTSSDATRTRVRAPVGTWRSCGVQGCRPGACENCDGEGYQANPVYA
jgi:hypothetical protein